MEAGIETTVATGDADVTIVSCGLDKAANTSKCDNSWGGCGLDSCPDWIGTTVAWQFPITHPMGVGQGIRWAKGIKQRLPALNTTSMKMKV
ncbi:hypothetical protein WA026_004411 [Henosepilachna vigintioctopunctata]|uniref:Uncharacterized protein n=1 Tax=Henosepilachna vigintioctopunctata TaxID=420089 RepID=A0AAW1VA82_9CUCU